MALISVAKASLSASCCAETSLPVSAIMALSAFWLCVGESQSITPEKCIIQRLCNAPTSTNLAPLELALLRLLGQLLLARLHRQLHLAELTVALLGQPLPAREAVHLLCQHVLQLHTVWRGRMEGGGGLSGRLRGWRGGTGCTYISTVQPEDSPELSWLRITLCKE